MRPIISKLLIVTLLGMSAILNKSFAQVSTAMDTVFVQTTRIPMPIQATGRNISVIKGADIQQMSFTSIDDLLQYIPGIEVQSRNAFGAQGDITMRGSTFTQVLILINGMKLNDPLTGHFNSYIPVTPTEIERIEVLQGAASAMYGADAVGGVINIITKAFSADQNTNTEISGQLNYGQHKLVNAQQGFYTQKNNFFLGGGFFMNQSDGELVKPDIFTDTKVDSFYNFFNLKTFGLSGGYKFNDQWRLQFRSSFDDRHFSARYFYTASSFDKSVENTRNWWNQLQVIKEGAKGQTDLNMAYRFGTDEFIFSPDFPSTNLHSTNFWNATINHLQVVNEQLSLKFGGQLDQRAIESTDRGDHDDLHLGAYVMGVFRPSSALNFTGSLRLDYDQNYDLEFTPQLNISYVFPKLVIRASAGRSIRAADYTERFVSAQIETLTPGRSLGNPDLIAESGWSEELGIDINLGESLVLKATGFLRQSTNLIDYEVTNADDIPNNQNLQPGENYFYASNIRSADHQGFSIEAWWNKNFGAGKNINWSLGYTNLETVSESENIPVYISSHARHLINTNLILGLNKFLFALNGLYKNRSNSVVFEQSPYQIWNLRLSYSINEQLGLQIQAHNLFDEKYQDIFGAQMPGRWLMGGIKFDL